MNRAQLAHVLRAAAQIADDPDIVVIGSQAILATYGEDILPPEATISLEAEQRLAERARPRMDS